MKVYNKAGHSLTKKKVYTKRIEEVTEDFHMAMGGGGHGLRTRCSKSNFAFRTVILLPAESIIFR